MSEKKFMIDPSTEKFGEMMIWAERYCLGRETYAPHDTIDFLRPLLPYLNEYTLRIFEMDISEARSLGDERIDAPRWREFLNDVKTELQRREENECES